MAVEFSKTLRTMLLLIFGVLLALLQSPSCNAIAPLLADNVTTTDATTTQNHVQDEHEDQVPEVYLNLASGNSLWTSLIEHCTKKPTLTCIEKTMYDYLRGLLDSRQDFQVTDFMKITKNQVDYDRIKREYDGKHKNETTTFSESHNTDVVDDDEPRSSIEEMARSLHDRSMEFLMTHDIQVQLPETIFDGAALRLSPRSFEDTGALVKLEFSPQARPEGRLFKKIKNFISQKLIFALLAILLVIKLLAAKFMFIMPMMIGAVAAKKLLLKVLIFLFPALKWLFKLCPYTPHGGKFHHHKHQIAHIHHVSPPHHHHGPSHHHHGHHHHGGGVEVIAPHADGPPHLHDDDWGGQPSLHHFVDHDFPVHHKPSYNPHEQELEYYSGGPALSYHLSTHRQDEDENEVGPSSWGQGQKTRKKLESSGRPLTPSELEKAVLKAEKEAMLKNRLQQERLRIQQENARLQEQLRQALKVQERLRIQTAIVKNRVSHISPSAAQPKLSPPPPPPHPAPSQFIRTPPVNAQQVLSMAHSSPVAVENQQQVHPVYVPQSVQQEYTLPNQIVPAQSSSVQRNTQNIQNIPGNIQGNIQDHLFDNTRNVPVTPAPAPTYHRQDVVSIAPEVKKQIAFQQALQKAASITYDPFYSPILEKIDKILNGLGFTDEPCRERLICSMYKNPVKFSPHSNLLSAELSRDSSELEKPQNTNSAVVRFYRYVQAARDGQDRRECLRLYAGCSINTEQ